MKTTIIIPCLFFSCFFSYAVAQPAPGQVYSLKNYCRARVLYARMAAMNADESRFRDCLDRIVRLSQDEYLLRETYKLACMKFRERDPAKAFIYARKAVEHGAAPTCLNHAFPPWQVAILAAERKRYVASQFDPGLAGFFEALHTADQYYRRQDNRGIFSMDQESIRQKMMQQDKVNEFALLRYVLLNGWPRQRSIDTVDCNYSITSSFAAMLSHWRLPYIDIMYRRAVEAAGTGTVPWFLPITINNLCLTRRPYMLNRFFSFFDFEFLYTGLSNLQTKADGHIDWTDDRTILEFLSLGFRMSPASSDIIVLFCSPGYTRSQRFALEELDRARKLLILLGNEPSRIRIIPSALPWLAHLPRDGALIGAWTIHYGKYPSIISRLKDTWLLDNKLNDDDLNNFFLQR